MAVCPICYERVGLGAGKTVRNADEMMRLASALRAMTPPDGKTNEEWRQVVEFSMVGDNLSMSLHDYAHRFTTVNPDWRAAGEWIRRAKAIVATGTRNA